MPEPPVATVRARGLREISGNIVLDRFAFQLHEPNHANNPVAGQNRPHHIWPNALPLDEGVLRIGIGPARGEFVGAQVRVQAQRAELRRFAAGRAWLETGSLLNARALTGYVKAHIGKVHAVAQWSTTHAPRVATLALDALIEWLAQHG